MKLKHSEPYAPLRQKAYPNIGDQLDAIYKLAAHLEELGLNLPSEVADWVEQCRSVKQRFPKR